MYNERIQKIDKWVGRNNANEQFGDIFNQSLESLPRYPYCVGEALFDIISNCENERELEIVDDVLLAVCGNRSGTLLSNIEARMSYRDNPLFIRVSQFDDPDGPYCWRGLAAQIEGNDMYGKIIILETEDEVTPGTFVMGEEVEVIEWDWNGGVELEGEELEHAKELYAILNEKETERDC